MQSFLLAPVHDKSLYENALSLPHDLVDSYSPSVDGPLTPSMLESVHRRNYQEEGVTDLMLSAFVGDSHLVKNLIKKKGRDIYQKDKRHLSALDWGRRGLGGEKLVFLMEKWALTAERLTLGGKIGKEIGDCNERCSLPTALLAFA